MMEFFDGLFLGAFAGLRFAVVLMLNACAGWLLYVVVHHTVQQAYAVISNKPTQPSLEKISAWVVLKLTFVGVALLCAGVAAVLKA